MIKLITTIKENKPGDNSITFEVENEREATMDEVKLAYFIRGAIAATTSFLDPAARAKRTGPEE